MDAGGDWHDGSAVASIPGFHLQAAEVPVQIGQRADLLDKSFVVDLHELCGHTHNHTRQLHILCYPAGKAKDSRVWECAGSEWSEGDGDQPNAGAALTAGSRRRGRQLRRASFGREERLPAHTTRRQSSGYGVDRFLTAPDVLQTMALTFL